MNNPQYRVTLQLKPEALAELLQRGALRLVIDQELDLSTATVVGAWYEGATNCLAVTFQGEDLPNWSGAHPWNAVEVVPLEVTPEREQGRG